MQGLVICLICLGEVADLLVIIRCYTPGSVVSVLHRDGYIIVLPMVSCVKFITIANTLQVSLVLVNGSTKLLSSRYTH